MLPVRLITNRFVVPGYWIRLLPLASYFFCKPSPFTWGVRLQNRMMHASPLLHSDICLSFRISIQISEINQLFKCFYHPVQSGTES